MSYNVFLKRAVYNFYSCLIIFLLGPFSLFAQTGIAEFNRITIKNEKPNLPVPAIFRDSKGLMWFGTQNGLFQFDGYEYKEFKSNYADKATLSDYRIYDMCEDKDGALWLATFSGVNKYNRASSTFSRFYIYDKPKELVDNFVLQVKFDKMGRLWTKKVFSGLFQLHPETQQFEQLLTDNKNPADILNNDVVDTYIDKSGPMWFCVNDKKTGNVLGNYNYENKHLTTYKHNPADQASLSNIPLRKIFKDSKGNIWVGLQNGLEKLNVSTGKFTHYRHDAHNEGSITEGNVIAMEEDDEGMIWIGTENNGLDRVNPATANFIHFKSNPTNLNTLSSNFIYTLYNDKAGTLWIGTDRGLNTFSLKPKKFHNSLFASKDGSITNQSKIYEIITAKDGMMWYCTEKGLYRFDGKNKPQSMYLLKDAEELVQDKSGKLWMSGEAGFASFDIANNKAERFLTIAPDSFDVNIIWTLYTDDEDNLWMGTGGAGLKSMNLKTNKLTRYIHDPTNKNSISSNEIGVIYRCKDMLWLAPYKEGLNSINLKTGKVTRYPANPSNPDSLSFPIVTAIYNDSKNRLWVGTGDGLNLLNKDGKTFTRLSEKNGLANASIRDKSIVEDTHGNIWIATMEGISKINGETLAVNNYDARDGFQVNKEAMLKKESNGQMILFGINGITIFNPDEINNNTLPPQVAIVDFQIFNTSIVPGKNSPLQSVISETKEITLSYKQSFFSIGFTAQNYIITEKNQYAYKLEGFEKDWTYAGTRRVGYYTNVPPGEYTFRVKAANNDGVWNETGASLKIIITPPFWLTWWFRILAAAAIAGVAIGIYRIRVHAIETQKKKLQQQVEEKTGQLLIATKEEYKARQNAEEANIELKKKNEELEQFAYVASHDLQEPLRMVSSFLTLLEEKYGHILEDKGKKYVHYAVDGAQRMRQIITDLLEFSKVGNTADNLEAIDLNEVVADIQVLYAQQIKEKNAVITSDLLPFINGYKAPLRQVFQNLVGNALKYTKADNNTMVKITAKDLGTHWQFSVADNGIGIGKEHFDNIFIIFKRLHNKIEFSGTGIGLAITKKIVLNMGGKIWVESEEGKGCTFYFTLIKK
jgi:signal transduction histidine kinase/ligand-binding sensor domain-containing protein